MPPRLITVQAVDPNIGTSKRSDWFIIATCSLDLYTMLLHPRYIFRERVPAHLQANAVLRQYTAWRPRVVLIEAVFAQANLVKECRRLKIPVLPLHRDKDKQSRLAGLSMRYSEGTIIHPPADANGKKLDWVETLEEELCSIGWVNGVELHDHDDQADAVNDCANYLTFDVRPEHDPAFYEYTVDRRPESAGRKRWKEARRDARRKNLEDRLDVLRGA